MWFRAFAKPAWTMFLGVSVHWGRVPLHAAQSTLWTRVLVLVDDGWPHSHAVWCLLAEHSVTQGRTPNGRLETIHRKPVVLFVTLEHIGCVARPFSGYQGVARLLYLAHIPKNVVLEPWIDRLDDDPHELPLPHEVRISRMPKPMLLRLLPGTITPAAPRSSPFWGRVAELIHIIQRVV